jgi:hypothetical protein
MESNERSIAQRQDVDEMYKSRVYGAGVIKDTDFVHKPFSAPVSTPSVYDMLGSNPKPAVSVSVLRNVSKSKFSRISGFSSALKSRLKADG